MFWFHSSVKHIWPSRLLVLLESKFLVKDNDLRGLICYLKGRKLSVKIGSSVSTPTGCWLTVWISQWPILGPVLFVLYISNIYKTVKFYSLWVSFYADDIRLYIGFNPGTEESNRVTSKIKRFLIDISSFIKLNF